MLRSIHLEFVEESVVDKRSSRTKINHNLSHSSKSLLWNDTWVYRLQLDDQWWTSYWISAVNVVLSFNEWLRRRYGFEQQIYNVMSRRNHYAILSAYWRTIYIGPWWWVTNSYSRSIPWFTLSKRYSFILWAEYQVRNCGHWRALDSSSHS
jgi:hypothetical protein